MVRRGLWSSLVMLQPVSLALLRVQPDNALDFFSSSRVFPSKRVKKKKKTRTDDRTTSKKWMRGAVRLSSAVFLLSSLSNSAACWLLNAAWIADEPFRANSIPLVSCSNHEGKWCELSVSLCVLAVWMGRGGNSVDNCLKILQYPTHLIVQNDWVSHTHWFWINPFWKHRAPAAVKYHMHTWKCIKTSIRASEISK